MKKIAFVIMVLFLAVIVIGCASKQTTLLGYDSVSALKGKTEAAVISAYGEPYRKYANSDGDKILEYRQAAKSGGAMNKLVKWSSFGALSGKDSAYADILKVYLANGIVKKATFEENVQTLTMPGL